MNLDESLAIYSLPFITALIGWVTNYIAIKMLFHPREPKKLLFFTLQGILPRRQEDIAVQLGRIVATELLSSDDLIEQLTNERSRSIYAKFIDTQSEKFIRDKLRKAIPVSSLLLRSRALSKLKSAFADELMVQLPALVETLTTPKEGALDIEQLVEDRVRAFPTDRLERILYQIVAKEFHFIELLGAVLGFIIGVLQLAFILIAR
ncbi:DUF445 domain-containing protein [Gilvimarinus sp. F26214L]|uniref:DUF445 domain-containing protein n=1 Tax=Gilvimarinus sp. DZF01 TaxID=3461371 RepID=UPI004045E431